MSKLVVGNLGNVLLVVSVTVLALGTSAYATGLLNYQNSTSTTGVIASVYLGVYKDRLCTQNLTSISWGTVYPAGNATVHVYLRNQGNLNVTLTKALSNWNPSIASNYLTLSWNYTGQVIRPSTVLHLALILTASPSINNINSFNFIINITSQG